MQVRAGTYAVEARLPGYATDTKSATVVANQTTVVNFELTPIETYVEVTADPWRILPDGESTSTVTVTVRDAEGRRLADEQVTWNVDLGTVVSSDAVTDAIGEARLVLRAPDTPGTATVAATACGTTGIGYVEFASPTAPSVRITAPILDETVSGKINVTLQASDPGGANPGIVQLAVVVDGQPLGTALSTNPSIAWTTFTLPNGTHSIRAAASDGDAECGYSQAVPVTTSNGVYNVAVDNGMFDANDPDPAKRLTTISARQDQATNWEIEITKRGASSPTRVFTGTGTTISATWNGTDSGGNPASPGQYNYTISASTFSIWDYIVFLRTDPDDPTALLVEGSHFGNNSELLNIVEDACEARGFQVITVPIRYATWERFQFFMNVYEPEVLYVVTHGHYEIRTGVDCEPPRLPQVSEFTLKDSEVYAYRPQDNQGNYFPEYPEPGQPAYARIPIDPPVYYWPQKMAHYVSELGLTLYSPLRLVWMDTCLDGRIGSLYGDLADRYNPYAVDIYGANDLAYMFGIYDNAWTIGASYAGFFELSFPDDRYRDFLGTVFGSMKVGYSLDQAVTRDAWYDGRHTGSYPGGIDEEYGPSPGWPLYGVGNPCDNWRVPMPPYHNLRIHGNPWSTYLSP